MADKVFIIGAGTHAKSLAARFMASYEVWFICEHESAENAETQNIVNEAKFFENNPRTDLVVNGIGLIGNSVASRTAAEELYSLNGFRISGFIAESTSIHGSSEVHPSVQIMETAYVSNNVRIGSGVLIGAGVLIEHNSVIEKGAFIGPGAIICGSVTIQTGSVVGAGAILLPGAIVETGTIVPAGTRFR